jgi:hypothetical protein
VRLYWTVTLVICLTLLAGCASAGSQASAAGSGTPTVAPFFAGAPAPRARQADPAAAALPSVAPLFRAETITPRPTRTRRPPATVSAARGALGSAYTETVIYDDGLVAGWTVEHSVGVKYDLADTTHAFAGSNAIAITPTEDFGALFITLSAAATQSYPRDAVLGIGFQLNAGSKTIAARDLAVTIVGSNALKYYAPDDKSVNLNGLNFFSETRLYFLDVNRSLTPETWVEIVVWLNELPYDPDYANVTGIYIKSDAGFRQTYYIDKVMLILRASRATPAQGGA